MAIFISLVRSPLQTRGCLFWNRFHYVAKRRDGFRQAKFQRFECGHCDHVSLSQLVARAEDGHNACYKIATLLFIGPKTLFRPGDTLHLSNRRSLPYYISYSPCYSVRYAHSPTYPLYSRTLLVSDSNNSKKIKGPPTYTPWPAHLRNYCNNPDCTTAGKPQPVKGVYNCLGVVNNDLCTGTYKVSSKRAKEADTWWHEQIAEMERRKEEMEREWAAQNPVKIDWHSCKAPDYPPHPPRRRPNMKLRRDVLDEPLWPEQFPPRPKPPKRPFLAGLRRL